MLVGKTPLILAPIVVAAVVLFLAFWAGRRWERSMKRYAASFIDPVTHADLMETLRRILTPPDVDHACFLPEVVQQHAADVLQRADWQATRRSREELRRRGF